MGWGDANDGFLKPDDLNSIELSLPDSRHKNYQYA